MAAAVRATAAAVRATAAARVASCRRARAPLRCCHRCKAHPRPAASRRRSARRRWRHFAVDVRKPTANSRDDLVLDNACCRLTRGGGVTSK
eukprot:scaffold26335_cov45-Phaeocystis_antarctica.AAC.2